MKRNSKINISHTIYTQIVSHIHTIHNLWNWSHVCGSRMKHALHSSVRIEMKIEFCVYCCVFQMNFRYDRTWATIFFFLLCCILKNVSRFLLRRFLLRRRMIITFGQFIVHYLRSYFLWFVKLYNKLFQHEVTIKSYKWNIYIFYMKLMQMCIISLMAIFNTMHFMDFNAAIVQKLFFSIILGLKDLIQFKVKKWLEMKSLSSLMLITIIIKQTLVASWKLRVMSISYHYA